MGLPAALAVAGIAGAAISAYGTYEQGQATAAADSYRAQVAANNAKIARENAIMDVQAGETAAVNQGLKTRAHIGTQMATQGAAGVDVNSGSAADVRAGTEEIGMVDALTIRSNAAKQAFSQEVAATSQDAQSHLDTMAGEQAGLAGEIGAAGTLLSGVSTVGGNYARWQNAGA